MKGILWGVAAVIIVMLCISMAHGIFFALQSYDPNVDIDYLKFSMFFESSKPAFLFKLSIINAILPFLIGGYISAKKSVKYRFTSAIVIAVLFSMGNVYSIVSGHPYFTNYEELFLIVLMMTSSLSGAYLFTRKRTSLVT